MIALQQQQEPAVNYKALAWTIGLHALLLLVFFFFSYTIAPQVPPANEEGGIEVNLGTSEHGSGHDQPMSAKASATYQAAVMFKSVAAQSSVPKNIVQSSTDPDAPAVSNNNKKNGPATTNEKGHTQEKPKYTYGGETGPGGNSAAQNRPGTNEGNDNGHGDKGVPSGTPGAPNYTGTPGNGTGGIGHNLRGRSITPDRFEAEFSESGKVVIHVTVDQDGEIIYKRVMSSSGAQLTKLALEKLSSAHFSKSESPEQSGDITIYFTTRK